jgi:hypothetical protein
VIINACCEMPNPFKPYKFLYMGNFTSSLNVGYKTHFHDLHVARLKKSHEEEMQWSFIWKAVLFYHVPGGLYGIACLECEHLSSQVSLL